MLGALAVTARISATSLLVYNTEPGASRFFPLAKPGAARRSECFIFGPCLGAGSLWLAKAVTTSLQASTLARMPVAICSELISKDTSAFPPLNVRCPSPIIGGGYFFKNVWDLSSFDAPLRKNQG